MLTRAWKPLDYHPLQSLVWRTKARFVNLACGRGSGKTELARRRVVRFLSVKKPWYDPMYFYALPTYNQAKRVAWRYICDLVPPHWVKSINVSEMVIRTIFGSELHVVGMDKPQRVEGTQWDGCVIDEACDQKPGSFGLSVLPALSHRTGWCWRIGVPKRVGVGAAEFKEAFFAAPQHGHPGFETSESQSYTWVSEDILSPDKLKWAREHLSDKDYQEQYLARWTDVSGLVFYAFDEVLSVRGDLTYDPSKPLIVGSDFNVDPMSWVICQRPNPEARKLHVLDELFIRNTNTRETLDELYRKYGEHQSGWQFYGDASGRARNTRASSSDYAQIKNDKRFRGAKVFYPDKNPARADRFAACNALFKNAAGNRDCLVHPRCVNLIKDLTSRAYEPGTTEPDDYGDIGHITDALGYVIHRLFPVRVKREATPGVAVMAL